MSSPSSETEFSQLTQPAKRGTLRIAETFVSRQGEGSLTGTESQFIRASGCNLRCWFCDTPYASWNPEGSTRTVDSLVDECLRRGIKHVVLTGGEPLLFEGMVELNDRLREMGFHTTIETAGTVDPGVVCDLLSLSPKFSSSGPDATQHPRWAERHHERRQSIPAMQQLIQNAVDSQVKFVLDDPSEFDELREVVDALGVDGQQVWVMPQAVSVDALDRASQWLRPWCDQHGFHYCDRMQIRWYGNRRGT